MSHPRRHPAAALVLAAGLALSAAPAQADSLETPFLGADNLAAAGGWQAWSAAQPDGRYRLTVRGPDGTVSTPVIDAFGAPVDPAIGTGVVRTASTRTPRAASRPSTRGARAPPGSPAATSTRST